MASKSRMLIVVHVSGSIGPIRLLVSRDDLVAAVVRRVLKEYAFERRLPVLGKDPAGFDLYCTSVDRALSSCTTVGSTGCWTFWMYTKMRVDGVDSGLSTCKKQPVARMRSFISKSLNLMIGSVVLKCFGML